MKKPVIVAKRDHADVNLVRNLDVNLVPTVNHANRVKFVTQKPTVAVRRGLVVATVNQVAQKDPRAGSIVAQVKRGLVGLVAVGSHANLVKFVTQKPIVAVRRGPQVVTVSQVAQKDPRTKAVSKY
jgi:hypothetical protein